jgi:hypothetical protein
MPRKEVHNKFVGCNGNYAYKKEMYLFIQILFRSGTPTSAIYGIVWDARTVQKAINDCYGKMYG